MAGLVSYASSDDDEEEVQDELAAQPQPAARSSAEKSAVLRKGRLCANQETTSASQPLGRGDVADGAEEPLDADVSDTEQLASAPALAPVSEAVAGDDVLIGPARPEGSLGDTDALPPAYDDAADAADIPNPDAPPLSPYAAERALLRQLTLPRVPDFAIPGSPPGTPPPGQAALDGKFETFLALKRNKATHFNARLAQSGAMKNPAVQDKLMAFVGLEAPGPAQYGTVLPVDVWNPAPAAPTGETTADQPIPPPIFPAWAYRTQLRKVQEDLARQRARTPGERVEFVPATGGAAPAGSGTNSATGKRKSRFD